ncbi:autoinducer-2 kinase [Sulfurimonas sp. HSL3-7]|uniref:autoinducer-2 kinase n=1 Tax=Sulfonitrofixus jiaomeiensis TaxID=3131938 RepID=UPI0031F81EA8
MSQGYFLTIDAGTGSGRAVIFDTLGNQVGIGQQEWTHLSEEGVANSMGFDYQTNWTILSSCIQKAIDTAGIKAEAIKAVTATSMREGIVLYDREGKELFGVANVDARADREVTELKREFAGSEERFYTQSGQTYALGALPRLLWLKRNRPHLYEKTASMNMISDWVLTKLSGVIASEPSNAGTSGIFSLEKRQWVPEMAKKLGLKDDIFPPVYESGAVIGEVTRRASEETGLAAGTPVVTGGGDVQLGSAGLGVVEAGEVAVLGGTFWQQLVNMPTAKTDPNMDIRINPHVIPGISQAEGITFFSGLVMRWFRDALCQSEVSDAKRRGIDPYAYLEELASNVPVGANGILPIFSDVMHYGRWYHAAPSFLNLSLDPAIASKGAMFRSLEENAAIVSMLNLEAIFRFTGVQNESITFAGGASKGTLWSQILADVTGKEVKIPNVNEATSLGGAFACGVATGEYKSIAEAAKNLVQWDKCYNPDTQNHAKYREVASRWQAAYASQLKLVDQEITTSMWRAPGL